MNKIWRPVVLVDVYSRQKIEEETPEGEVNGGVAKNLAICNLRGLKRLSGSSE